MTNGSKIRSMSDEELSKVIMCPVAYNNRFRCKYNILKDCYKCCEDWLKQEAEEYGAETKPLIKAKEAIEAWDRRANDE